MWEERTQGHESQKIGSLGTIMEARYHKEFIILWPRERLNNKYTILKQSNSYLFISSFAFHRRMFDISWENTIISILPMRKIKQKTFLSCPKSLGNATDKTESRTLSQLSFPFVFSLQSEETRIQNPASHEIEYRMVSRQGIRVSAI